jgi:hypothetical protein
MTRFPLLVFRALVFDALRTNNFIPCAAVRPSRLPNLFPTAGSFASIPLREARAYFVHGLYSPRLFSALQSFTRIPAPSSSMSSSLQSMHLFWLNFRRIARIVNLSLSSLLVRTN